MHLGATPDKNGPPVGQSPGVVTMTRTGIVLLVLLAASTWLGADAGGIYLKAPGLRLINEPSVVIPAAYRYTNRPVPLPRYRDPAGNPLEGWSRKYIPTRRFKSDQSAWIYYHPEDLGKTINFSHGRKGGDLCIWPGGSIIVIESYQGGTQIHSARPPVEIAVLSKAVRNTPSYGQAFFAAEWSYARFRSHDDQPMDAATVHECHQCHAIAFQLTGDLVFTRFP